MSRVRAFLLILFFGFDLQAQVCDLVISACPEKLSNTILTVPLNVVSISNKVPYCGEAIQKNTAAVSRQISIVIVVDESGSMVSTDPEGARFTVPSSLLGRIQTVAPTAEVGIVAFSGNLEYDYRKYP